YFAISPSLGLAVFSSIKGKSQGERQYKADSKTVPLLSKTRGLLEFEGIFLTRCHLLTKVGATAMPFFSCNAFVIGKCVLSGTRKLGGFHYGKKSCSLSAAIPLSKVRASSWSASSPPLSPMTIAPASSSASPGRTCVWPLIWPSELVPAPKWQARRVNSTARRGRPVSAGSIAPDCFTFSSPARPDTRGTGASNPRFSGPPACVPCSRDASGVYYAILPAKVITASSAST